MAGSRIFTLSTDIISISDSASIQTLNPSFSLACWINLNPGIGAVGFGALIILGPGSFELGLNIIGGPSDSEMQLFSNTPFSVTSATSQSNEFIPFGQWTHVAMTCDGVTEKILHLFINGKEVTYFTKIAGAGTSPAWSSVSIGNDGSDDAAICAIAEARFYGSVLTPTQIYQLYLNTGGSLNAAGAQSSLAAYLHICGLSTTEPDSSGHNNIGTVAGTTVGTPSPGYGACISPYSSPDDRSFGIFPNSSRNLNQTLIYDVQTSDNAAIPGTDSRASGPPEDSRANAPQNSRTPGTYGPGE